MAQLTKNMNYLQPTGFKLLIDRVNYPNLQFFAQSVNHPSVSLPPTEIPSRKLTRLALPGDKLDYGELTANILMDEDMNSYEEIHGWMRRIIDEINRPPSDFVAREEATLTHSSDITLSILSSNNNPIKEIRYIDAIPVTIGDFQFESTVADVTYITFPVTFAYSYFDIV